MGGQAVHNLPEAPGPQDTGPGLGRKEDCESPALWGGQSEPPVRGTQRFPLGTPTFRRNTVGRDAGGKDRRSTGLSGRALADQNWKGQRTAPQAHSPGAQATCPRWSSVGAGNERSPDHNDCCVLGR